MSDAKPWYTLEPVSEMTIRQFAERKGLRMTVVERETRGDSRYYAHFAGVDEKGDGVLIGTHGNGPNPDAAIADYATKISFKVLVEGAHTENRREIRTPRLYHTEANRV